jgi:FKBP-type peptidyl-prolyl cis-trans isomerase FklB
VLESGLQYEVLIAGEGAKPSADDNVRTHYHGTLIDGTVFDSSYERGEPAEFPVGGVIAGWVEALQLMGTGSKWRLAVPSELAYAGQAAGSIPPHSVLVFDVELLEIL